MRDPYRILSDLRAGAPLADDDLAAVARGASDGSWSDAVNLGARTGSTHEGYHTSPVRALLNAGRLATPRAPYRGQSQPKVPAVRRA